MSEHTPQHPKPPSGASQPPGPSRPGQPPGKPPSGEYPPPGQYPPAPQPPGQYPPAPPQPPGQYPPAPPTPPGQYPTPPPTPPPSQYPTPPPEQYPPAPPPQPPTDQYPPAPPEQYPPPPDPGYPPPPTTACPDPCDQDRPWGPPQIPPDCCPEDETCCPAGSHPRTWDEIDDPCVRASSAACGFQWTKLTCTCGSSNAECTCDEWDCGGYPHGVCVPCKPCEGLVPDGDGSDPGSCDDPQPGGCNSDELRRQLEALKKCISSQQGEKAKIDAEIKARQEREKELTALIAAFDPIVDKYKSERHKLICREDCLKGFYRDTSKVFRDPQRFPAGCLDAVQAAINAELCRVEKAKCCQKNLELKLEKVTRLIWEQQQAEQAWKKAEDAFKNIKDLPKWMGDQFTALESLKDQIAAALNDKDPQKHKFAFYLFYWKFVPLLCKRFKVPICCEQEPQTESPPRGEEPATPVHLGCEPGDWHPSVVTVERLRELICCAWAFVRARKQAFHDTSAAVDTVQHNLDYIKKQNEDDAKTLEDRIKTGIEKVVCAAASGR